MSMEEQYRRELESSLWQVHETTAGSEFPGGILVNRMNALLRAAAESHFGVGCSESLAVLYETIGKVGPEMIERSEDLPLLYFARSFAVVVGEAIGQLQQNRKENTVSSPAYPESAETDETAKEDQLVMEKEKQEEDNERDFRMALTASPTDSSHSNQSGVESRSSLSPLAPPAETRLNWRALSPAAICAAPRSAAAAADDDDTRLYGTEAWRQALQRQRPDKILDFSLAAIKGRVNIFCLPRSVRADDVRVLLEPFGPILDFYFHPAKGIHDGFVLAKLESRSMAGEAIAHLDGTVMDGTKINVKRAMYLMRPRNVQPPLLQLQQEQSCRQEVAALAAVGTPVTVDAAAAVVEPVGDGRGADRDSDEESYHSMFSVD